MVTDSKTFEEQVAAARAPVTGPFSLVLEDFDANGLPIADGAGHHVAMVRWALWTSDRKGTPARDYPENAERLALARRIVAALNAPATAEVQS